MQLHSNDLHTLIPELIRSCIKALAYYYYLFF